MNTNRFTKSLSFIAPLCFFSTVQLAYAQKGDATSSSEQRRASVLEEVVVTARRREETLLEAPVVITAFTSSMLQRNAISTLEGIAQMTPQLQIGEASTPSGGSISLRGVTTTTGEISADQSVLLSIDNVGVSRGTLLRVGQYDLQQVEVIKGPQALFFGKNSPGGIIAMTTKGPTDELFVSGRMGYESEGDQTFGEAIVSGPITDTLGGRAVFYTSEIDGYRENGAKGIEPYIVKQAEGPDSTEYFSRVVLEYEPTDRLRVRAAGSYSDVHTTGPDLITERYYCPGGVSPSNPIDDCKLNGNYYVGTPYSDGVNQSVDPLFKDNTMVDLQVTFGVTEINYNLTNELLLTSVTGYFENDNDTDFTVNFSASQPGGGGSTGILLGTAENYKLFTQEIRLSSDFDSRYNFVAGLYYDDNRFKQSLAVGLNVPPALVVSGGQTTTTDGDTYSGFGQFIVDITETLELTVGARWTEESKDLTAVQTATGQPLPINKSDLDYNNLSPDVVLTWTPNDTFSVYGAYREGFKSGGFNQGTSAASNGYPSFNEETVHGGELGAKASLLGGSLFLSGAVYQYIYEDLQLNQFTGVPPELVNVVTNAGDSKAEGFEVSASFAPSGIEGLSMFGSTGYNKHTFDDYVAACYIGQTAATGCLPIGPFGTLGQDESGEQLPLAPKWASTLGFNYEAPLPFGGLDFGVHANASFSDSYDTHVQKAPGSKQDSFWLTNAGFSVFDGDNEGWRLDFIGRNLTQEYYAASAFQTNGEPSVLGFVNRGRELIVQLTIYPAAWYR